MEIRPTSTVAQPPPAVSDGASSPTESPQVTRAVPAPVQTAAAVQQAPTVPSPSEVAQAVKSLNRAMENFSHGLEFSVDEDSHRTVIKVVDANTKELIRQIPSVEILEIAKALDQAQGLLIRQKA
ncbi:N/A [soil metagenome]